MAIVAFPQRLTRQFPYQAKILLVVGLLLIMTGTVLQTNVAAPVRLLATLALAWWLPGALLVAHWRLPGLNAPLALVLALGLGLGWMVALALLLHWVPGPVGFWPLVLTYECAGLVLGFTLLWRPPQNLARPFFPQATPVSVWAWLLALLLCALLLRLPGLGYHELHVDEVSVLRAARLAIEGSDNVLAEHTKGPGEILVALVAYRALGTVDEGLGRLPFALMSVGSILALALLGQRMFGAGNRTWHGMRLGLWAGVLLALNGFALGLSRIVQYQGGTLLLSVLVVLAGWEAARTSSGRWLALMMTLGACGVALHYEMALLAPALLLCVGVALSRADARQRPRLVRTLLGSGLAGAGLVAACYVPVLLNPNFTRTQSYLTNRVGDSLNFNLAFFVEMGTFYNSTIFFGGLLLLVGIGIVMGWHQTECTVHAATSVLVLWFVPYLVLYLVIMRFPGTHFYILMPGWSLLAALPLSRLTDFGSAKIVPRLGRWRTVGLATVGVWLAISVGYLYLMFLRQQPEYLINYPATRVPIYWAPYGDNIPQEPRFGFPIYEGWKALGVLAEWGYLGESYSSNERSRHLRRWYIDTISRRDLADDPDYVFVAQHLQQPDPTYDSDLLEANYLRVGEVRVRGEPRIAIWAREPLPVAYVTYDAEHFADVFDNTLPPLAGPPRQRTTVRNRSITDALTLTSAKLSAQTLAPGETLHITLRWLTTEPLEHSYKLFVHLTGDDAQPLAQWDGLPGMNTRPTDQWEAGEAVTDHVLLPVPEQLTAGTYRVLAGLYDPETGERLGGAVEIGTVKTP